MTVSPQTALLDQPATVSIQGLAEGARTTVTATATDAGGTTWSASAKFKATSSGTVSLEQPSLGGSYSGVDPMGLFNLMVPPAGSGSALFVPPRQHHDVTFQASVDGRVVATASARRQAPDAVGVVARQLRPAKDGIYGTLALPRSTTAKRPGLLVFGGSEGGITTSVLAAGLLAAHGYPSLALAYFEEPGLPRTLERIPLEYFAKALAVLRDQPGVDPHHLLVVGVSRGGEAALLLGAYFPQLVHGVVANVPGAYVNPSRPGSSTPTWTLSGRPLPVVSPADFGRPDLSAGTPQAAIPVERIRGPVLLACGELDLIWPSCANVDAVTRRLTSHRFTYLVTVLRYRDAGHLVGGLNGWFSSLTDDFLEHFGGTVAGTQAAQADAHAKLLTFLASQ